jgi:uncharacterized protein YbjT (DUF2867 family)
MNGTTDTGGTIRQVLVVGATGTQGGATARELLRTGVSVRALTRDPASAAAKALADAGAQVVRGDLDDPAGLREALAGVDGVFSVQDLIALGDEGEARQGIAVIDAARAAGVRHLVQASGGGADRSPDLPGFTGKSLVEQHLRSSGISHTIVAPTWFMSNWDWPYFRPAILAGVLALPLDPTTPLQQVAPVDIGRLAALAFADPERWAGQRVELAGDERPIARTAAALGASLGRPVSYRQVSWEAFEAEYGSFFAGLFRWYADHGYRADIPALRRTLPGLLDLDGYLDRRGSFAHDRAA